MARQRRFGFAESVSAMTPAGKVEYASDGARITSTLTYYHPERVTELVDGHPKRIYATLADYEDEEGRVPAER